MSHATPETWSDDRGVRHSLDVVQKVTGTRPTTCPWRALYHPMMADVYQAHVAWDDGNLGVYLTPDEPAVLHDAVAAYRVAVIATRAEQDKRRRERDKARRPPRM